MLLLAGCGVTKDEHRPLAPDEIADPPSRTGRIPSKDALDRRFRNLYLADGAIQEYETRRHLIDHRPICVHLMYDRWRTPPVVDVLDAVPYETIDQYAAWGVQRIQLHHDVWTNMGRTEPINEAAFTRFVDYCHKKGIEVGVYLIMGQASLADPELPMDMLTLPPYMIRPPETIGADPTIGRGMWVSTDVHSPAWRQYLLEGIERLFTRYKVDGIYYDDGTVLGAYGNDRSDIYGIRYWSRTGRAPLGEDMFNQVSNICRRHNRWMTVYSNGAYVGMNDGFPSNVVTYRLVGEAGPVKKLDTFWNINRGANRGPFHVNVWCDHNTMPPDRPFYACNLVFLQFPYLMSWRKPSPEPPGPLLFNDEQVALWAHFAAIYKEMTPDDTVAFLNVTKSRLFEAPITNDHVAVTVLVNDRVWLIAANIGDTDETIRFTVPLRDLESGGEGFASDTAVTLPAGGSLRLFEVGDLSPFAPEETTAETVYRRIVRERAVADTANLALEARVQTGTDGIFHYVKATQAVDGNTLTFWQPNPMKRPECWWDTYWTTQAFDEVPPDWNNPAERDRRWYRIELRQSGPVGQIEVVTRPEDAGRIRAEVSNRDWESFMAPPVQPTTDIQGDRATVNWSFTPVPARYIQVSFADPADVNERLYEIRVYRNMAGVRQHAEDDLVPLNSREITADITPAENIVPPDARWSTVGTHGFGAVMWQALDLGRVYTVDRVQVIPAYGEPNYCQYFVFVSEDRENWRLLLDQTENTDPSTPRGKTFAVGNIPIRYAAFTATFVSGGPLVGDYYGHRVGGDVTLDQYLKMLRDETWDIRAQSALAEFRLRGR